MIRAGDESDEAPPWETDPQWLCQRKIYGMIRVGRYDEVKLEEHLGNLETGIKMRQQAVKKRPDHTSYHYGLGHALMNVERWAEADRAFQQVIALSLAKDDIYYLNDARYQRALCLKALGQREELAKVKAELPDNF